MPRYFFEFSDQPPDRGDGGVEFVSDDEARNAALGILASIFDDPLITPKTREATVKVRGESGEVILEASVLFTLSW